MRIQKRVVRPPGLAPRFVGAPVEPDPKPVEAPPVSREDRLTIHKFLLFLRNRQLDMRKLLRLPNEEQSKLRKEFVRIKDTGEVYRSPAHDDPTKKIHIVTEAEKKHFEYARKAEVAVAFLESHNFFLHEMNTALRYIKRIINSRERIGDVAVDHFPDSLEDLQDLKQNIRLELIEATVKYGNKMSGALAYRIAKNMIAEFVGKRVEESKNKVELDDTGVDEDGEEQQIGGFGEGMTVANSTTVDGVGPSFPTSSWGWGQVPDTGHKVAGGGTRTDGGDHSTAVAAGPPPDLMETKRPELEALVRKYHGTKRKVGEILLSKGDTLVRGIPGIPKSTVWLIRKQILEEFRKILGVAKPFTDLELPVTGGHS